MTIGASFNEHFQRHLFKAIMEPNARQGYLSADVLHEEFYDFYNGSGEEHVNTIMQILPDLYKIAVRLDRDDMNKAIFVFNKLYSSLMKQPLIPNAINVARYIRMYVIAALEQMN
jgi:hypothetical protein